jgi:hypothetical protein
VVNFVGTRAWTLQEEVLPPRSIIYPSGAIYWLCNHESYVENAPGQPRGEGFCFHSGQENKLLFHLPARKDKGSQSLLSQQDDGEDAESKDNTRFFYWWYEILNNYLVKHLSFDRDRLPGIAGLAKEFARRTDTQYLCGLWREDFINGLGWKGYGARIESSEYLGPTWSWASLDPLTGDDLLYDRYLGEKLLVDENTAKVVDVYIANEAQDSYGQVKEAVVILAGFPESWPAFLILSISILPRMLTALRQT